MVAQVGWVLLSYRMPREPSTPRIAVWRKLRKLGVVQVGDGLVAMPDDARTREALEWAAGDVEQAGGTATVWRSATVSAADQLRLVSSMTRARAAEYAALHAKAVAATADSHPRRSLATLRRELREIRRRDFFPPPEAEAARQAVDALAAPIPVTSPQGVPSRDVSCTG